MSKEKKSNLYKIQKIQLDKIISKKDYNIGNISFKDAVLNGETVSVMNNQVLHKIRDYYKENNLSQKSLSNVVNDIVNIVVPIDDPKQAEKNYIDVAEKNFTLNDTTYKRFCSGSGQIRRNTVTFIREKLYDYLFESLCCGLTPADFGDMFNTAKFNAYFGLNMSGVHFLKSAPRVCVVDDFQQIRPHMQINYITTKASRKSKRKIIEKNIETPYYDDKVEGSGDYRFPPLNSFDGQGLCDPEYAKKIAIELGYLKAGMDEPSKAGEDGKGYLPSQYIIRAPWVKGLVVTFDWKAYCKQYGVTTLEDIFGDKHNIKDVDLLISKSQFKMWKIYAQKGGWKYHSKSMKKYNLLWGVVMPNKEHDDNMKALNYQYVNSLILDNNDIDSLCKTTESLLTKLCNGDVKKTYKTLIKSPVDADIDEGCDDTDIENVPEKQYQSFFQKAVTHNFNLLQDEYIQQLVLKECRSKFKNAKIGKLLCKGNFQFLVSDPVAQIQAIIRTHAQDGEKDKVEVKGLVQANAVYSNYWNKQNFRKDENKSIVLMRSPLIDQSEVAVRKLVENEDTKEWYKHIQSGVVLSIWDLTTLQCQNCDFDGDRVYSSNNPTLIKGAYKNPLPLLYPTPDTQSTGQITPQNLILADARGLNSKVGSISNKSSSFYAKLPLYDENSEEYIELLNRIKILGELVGVEIDKIKTGIHPSMPTDWKFKTFPKKAIDEDGRTKNICDLSKEEKQQIINHNVLVPDDKPYFFRYIYSYLDKEITSYRTGFNKESMYNYFKKIEELINTPTDSLTEDEQRTVRKYNRFFPVNDSDCTMNKICHKFEELEKELSLKCTKNSMLEDFITEQKFDNDLLNAVENMAKIYKKQRQFLTKHNNSNNSDTNKNIANQTQERYSSLYKHLRTEILQLFDDNLQTAFNYMVKAVKLAKCEYHFVWNVLDDLIFEIIPSNPYKETEE